MKDTTGTINFATNKTPTEVDGYVQESTVESKVVSIKNARTLEETPSIFKEGFGLIEAPQVFDGIPTEKHVQEAYSSIVKQLKKETSAREVFVFDHTIRSTGQGESKRQPIFLAHADYSSDAGIKRVQELLPSEFSKWETSRFFIVNIWQSLCGTIYSSPLAFADIRTVEDADFLPIKVVYDHRVGNIGYYQYSKKHEWYWFPLLESNEALIFKTFDSRPGSQHWSCPHTAFESNLRSDLKPGRVSIEFRILVLL